MGYYPWLEVRQIEADREKKHNVGALNQPENSAFQHYSRSTVGGKPTYNLRVNANDTGLYFPPPQKYQHHNSNCQLCCNHSKYVETWGSDMCTNHIPTWSP